MKFLGSSCTFLGVQSLLARSETLELVVMRPDEATLITVKGVEYGECCSTAVTMVRKVRGVDDVVQGEGIHPFLRP